MKTKHLLLFIALWTAVSAQQTHLDIKVPDRVEADLFGPVRSVRTIYETERFAGTSSRSSTMDYERLYDPEGNLLKSISIDIDDGTTNTTEYLYSPDGCLTGRVYAASGNTTNEIYSYMIDVPSRQILRVNLNSNDRRVTVYTPQGYEYCIEDRDSTNAVNSVTRIKRLPNNKEYEIAVFDGEDSHLRSTYLDWNSNGLLRQYRYHRPGTNEYISITKYTHPEKDERGNWRKRVARKDRIYKGERETYSRETAVREIEYYDE